MKVLVFNCGSSSIKYQLFDMPVQTVLARGSVQRIGGDGAVAAQKAGGRTMEIKTAARDHHQGFELVRRMLTDPADGVIASFDEIGACGHRVVHGGEEFTGSVVIDDRIIAGIEKFSDLAPLHNPPNLTGIREAMAMTGERPQVACFDTAFHQTIPPVAHRYALPHELYEKFRVRKYGFHGTSHRWVTQRAAAMLGKDPADANLITCHLGNGCSMAAVQGGRSIDTSMGLTPLEGLVMGTRCGDIDPAIVFYLARKGYKTEEMDALFNTKSGLLGISGISNDVRDLEDKAEKGDGRAQLALEIFSYRVRKYIGAYLAVLNRCDAIVFTGGIGENDNIIRRMVLENMDRLGVVPDLAKNDATIRKEGAIHAAGSPVQILVIQTDEEAAIARDTYDLVKSAA